MKHVVDVYCDVGPGLLIDAQFVPAWREFTFNQAVLDERYVESAIRGECCYLKDEADRYFSGSTEVFVDEPAPELVKYADRKQLSLRLEVPTGQLKLVGLCALIKDGKVKPGAEDFLSVQVTPGRYLVDAYSFVEQQVLLENGTSPVPGELPPSRWTRPLGWLTFALSVLSFCVLLYLGLFWRAPVPLAVTGITLAVLWPLHFLAYRISGERSRNRHNARAWKEHLASLPVLPSYVLVLRGSGAESAAVEGGGLL